MSLRPTRRAFWLLAGGLLPAAAAPLFEGFAWVTLGWGILVVVACLLDARRGVRPSALRAKREWPHKLSLGVPNTIELRIVHLGTDPVFVRVQDRVPLVLQPAHHRRQLHLHPRTSATVRYTVTPPARGAYEIECVDVSVESHWRLVQRTGQLRHASTLDVYPNIRDVGRYQRMLHRRRLRMLGLRPVRKLGKGTDFESLRDYVPDDEFRDINWKATAKAARLITQTFRTERSQNVILGIEAGRMMTTRVGALTKLDYAINSALLLAHVAADREDRVGLLVFSSAVHTFLAPRRGRRQVTAILEALHDVQPRLVEPDFASAVKTLRTKQKRRSLLVLFTDLLDDDAATSLAKYLHLLRPTHLPLVVAVNDPTVAEMVTRRPRSTREAYQSGVAAELLNERKQILQTLRRHGSLVLDTDPSALSTRTVNRYLEIKARQVL